MGGEEYRFSDFNIIHELPSGKAVICNTFSCAVAVLNQRETHAVKGNLRSLTSEELEELVDIGIIVPADIDEIALLREGIELIKADRTHATVTVLTTLDCNFCCSYCFQTRSTETMKPDTRDLVIQHVAGIASSLEACECHEGKPELGLCLTGGEPLLEIPAIEALVSGVRSSCRELGVELATTMITNGYLLTPDVASRLLECFPKWILQITIDGPRAIHDSRRVLRDGGRATHDQIVQNIRMLDPEKFKVNLRINVDKDNIASVEEVWEWANRMPNVFPYVSPVTEEANQGLHVKTRCFPSFEHGSMYRELASKGFVFDSVTDLLERGSICSAEHALSCCIDPNGYLYKCFDQCGKPEYAYAKLGDVKFNYPERARVFLSRNATNEDECVGCKLIPQCFGGCALAAETKGSHSCRAVKYLIEHELASLAED